MRNMKFAKSTNTRRDIYAKFPFSEFCTDRCSLSTIQNGDKFVRALSAVLSRAGTVFLFIDVKIR